MRTSAFDRLREYRAAVAVALFLGMAIVEEFLPDLFVPLAAVVLVVAPIINWNAYARLRAKRQARRARGLPLIESLRTATNAALYLALGSTVTAALGVFVAFRALGLVEALPRDLFLLALAYPPVLAVAPAIDWITTMDRLERVEQQEEDHR